MRFYKGISSDIGYGLDQRDMPVVRSELLAIGIVTRVSEGKHDH